MVHEHIRDSRDDDFEANHCGKSLKNINLKDIPPCSRDIGAFSSNEIEIIHYDPLDWRDLPAVTESIPPFSFARARKNFTGR
jgi:exodeoxyribonuclease V alpha subunit